MTAEEELKILKQGMLKRARITATILGIAAVTALIFMIYGFTQSVEAKRRAIEANEQRNLAVKAENASIEKIMTLEEQLKICQSEKSR
jgi:hypothetical protein